MPAGKREVHEQAAATGCPRYPRTAATPRFPPQIVHVEISQSAGPVASSPHGSRRPPTRHPCSRRRRARLAGADRAPSRLIRPQCLPIACKRPAADPPEPPAPAPSLPGRCSVVPPTPCSDPCPCEVLASAAKPYSVCYFYPPYPLTAVGPSAAIVSRLWQDAASTCKFSTSKELLRVAAVRLEMMDNRRQPPAARRAALAPRPRGQQGPPQVPPLPRPIQPLAQPAIAVEPALLARLARVQPTPAAVVRTPRTARHGARRLRRDRH